MQPVYPEKIFQATAAPVNKRVYTPIEVTVGSPASTGNTIKRARIKQNPSDLKFFMALLSSPNRPVKSIAVLTGNLTVKQRRAFSLFLYSEKKPKGAEREVATRFDELKYS